MGVPIQKVALDIVGPLPRTKHGKIYLLTTMCCYTKFPEAILLKRVDTMAVVDAMQGRRNHSGQLGHGLTNNFGEMGVVNKFWAHSCTYNTKILFMS